MFPQFADNGPLPMHGFARTSTWAVQSVSDGVAVLQLTDSEATRAVFPHAFELSMTIELGAQSLTTTLACVDGDPHGDPVYMTPRSEGGRVVNRGDAPFEFQALQHTYHALPDSREVRVVGLHGPYRDKVRAPICHRGR